MTNEERKQKVEAKGKERKNNREEGRRDEERQHLGKICLRFKLPTGPNPRLWTKKEALILGEITSFSIIEAAGCLPNSFQASCSSSTAPRRSATVSSGSAPPRRSRKFVWTLTFLTFRFRLALFFL